MKKKFLLIILFLFIWLISPLQISANEFKSFVTPVYPIRGFDYWPKTNNQTPYTSFNYYYNLIKNYNLSATWLFRYDALLDSQITSTAKFFNTNQERGLFLEITPSLTDAANITYPEGATWSDANRIFISGYYPEQRIKLINTAFSKFLKVFGQYPKSVGAWHIDAWTADYINQHFGVSTIIDCADQYSTDQYQIWGSWWGTPYYPSRHNIFVPAQTQKNKLPLIVTQWATRDPNLGYGSTVSSSTYSVQPNDYLLHKQDIKYFQKLLNIYTQNQQNKFGYLLVGIENDYDINQYKREINNQLQLIKNYQDTNKIKTTTLSKFFTWYHQTFPELSPDHVIRNINAPNETTWQMTTKYRIAYKPNKNKINILDYRQYNQNFAEPFLLTANPFHQLNINLPSVVDTVTNPKSIRTINQNQLKELINQPIPNLPYETNSQSLLIYYVILAMLVIIIFPKQFFLPLIILAGSVNLSLPLIKSGLLYPYGMGFWGPNGHDGIWHISIIQHFAKHWNLNSPILANTTLFNYHFLYDWILAIISKLTHISALNLYFQIIPPIIAILLGITTYKFTVNWTRSKTSGIISLILVYFGGNLGWLVNLYRNQPLGGESMFWSSQAISTLINPPLALSIILILIGISLYKKYLKSPSSTITYYSLIIIFGLLVHAKSYAGILGIFSFAILSLPEIIKLIQSKFQIKQQWKKMKHFKIAFFALMVSFISLIPIVHFSDTQIFQFNPLWFPRTMLLFPDRLNWLQLYNAIQAYWSTHNYLKAILADGLAISIFYIGNLGIRIIGIWIIIQTVWPPIRNKLKVSLFKLFPTKSTSQPNQKQQPLASDSTTTYLVIFTLTSGIIPLLFTQAGTPWNTIQFLYYTIFFTSIFTAKVIGNWLDNLHKSISSPNKIKSIITNSVILGILIINLPTDIGTLKQYLPFRAPSRIPYEELSALQFLQQQPEGRILSYPYHSELNNRYNAPKPLAYYESTAYISALTGKPVYLEDQVNLEILKTNWKTYRQQVDKFFYTLDQGYMQNFIHQYQIKYLYLLKTQTPNIPTEQLGFQKIFDNGLVYIYQNPKSK